MTSRTLVPLLAALAIAAGLIAATAVPAAALERPDRTFLRLVDEAAARGEITSGAALLEKFAYVFEPDAVDARFRVGDPTPLKCATDLVREFLDTRAALSPEAVARVEGWLAQSDPDAAPTKSPGAPSALAAYISPAGHFELTYSTTGTNAVPADDVDPANGVPDYVEWCAAYCDSSWQREVDDLGFTAPFVLDFYDIGFQAMGAYGFTTTTGGGTRIVLHRNFLGFPPNDDPDGDQKGAAKVTVAHEFKHATQYQGSFWSEGGWVELDATWVEDAVFDQTNDYYNFIATGSPIVAPSAPLDQGGTGSYEDCSWQEYMSQTYGDEIIYDLWERRKTHTAETMKTSYDSTLGTRGTSMPLGYEEFMVWCYLTGARATADIPGFGEAAAYPTSPLIQSTAALPWNYSGGVEHLAANFFRAVNGGSFIGTPRLVFTGTAGSLIQVHVVYHHTDGSESRQEIALDAANSANALLPRAWADLSALGIVVVNTKKSGGVIPFSVSLSEDAVTAVGDGAVAGAAPRFALEQNVPNPASPATRVRFRLPQREFVRLAVYDAAGRLVATLVGGTALGAGEHEARWDGRSDAGRAAAPGVYAYRLVAGRYSETRKLLLVR